MKLYQSNLSPFASRARLAAYAKGMDIEMELPGGGNLKAPEYLAINPIGKIPTLVLDDGTVIPESEIIVEYLDDVYPDRPLLPRTAKDRARARMLSRFVDLYLWPAAGGLFVHMNPATRDEAALAAGITKVKEALGHLEHFLGAGPYALDAEFTSADCALAPTLFLLNLVAGGIGAPDLFAAYPKLSAYWGHVQGDPHVARVIGEMQEMFATMMGGQAAAAPQS